MKLTVRLFVQRHANRTYTVSALLFLSISAYGPTLEECKLEVAGALAARLSEIDPEELHRYAPRPNVRLEKVAVELRPAESRGELVGGDASLAGTLEVVQGRRWLGLLVLGCANQERDRSRMTRRQLATVPNRPEPELVRVYQVEGEHMVRDLRTEMRTTDVGAVLGGQLDEFILAYLRTEKTQQA